MTTLLLRTWPCKLHPTVRALSQRHCSTTPRQRSFIQLACRSLLCVPVLRQLPRGSPYSRQVPLSLTLLPVLHQLPCGSPYSRQVSHSLSHLSHLSYPLAHLTPSRSLTHKPATRHSTPISHPIPLVSVCAVGVNVHKTCLLNFHLKCLSSLKTEHNLYVNLTIKLTQAADFTGITVKLFPKKFNRRLWNV